MMSYNKVILSVLLYGLWVVTCAQEFIRQFHFVSKSLSWTDAQQFCREHYTDLATVSSLDEVNKLQRPDSYSGHAWIGLRSKAVNYQNWGPGSEKNLCTGLFDTGLWYGHDCINGYYQVCYYGYKDSGAKNFFLSTALRSYAEARAFCRTHHTDLALIESAEENNRVKSLLAPGNYAWIHKPWLWAWSDGSSSTFTKWASDRPLEAEAYSCTVEEPSHSWRDVSCDQSLPFFCHHDVNRNEFKRRTIVKVSFHSDLDLTDPRNNNVLLQKIQEMIDQPGVKVTWRRPPRKTTANKKDEM